MLATPVPWQVMHILTPAACFHGQLSSCCPLAPHTYVEPYWPSILQNIFMVELLHSWPLIFAGGILVSMVTLRTNTRDIQCSLSLDFNMRDCPQAFILRVTYRQGNLRVCVCVRERQRERMRATEGICVCERQRRGRERLDVCVLCMFKKSVIGLTIRCAMPMWVRGNEFHVHVLRITAPCWDLAVELFGT